MKKIFSFLAAALMSAGMSAEHLHFYVSAMPEGTPQEGVEAYGTFGKDALVYERMAWQTYLDDKETAEDFVQGTADDMFGFRCKIDGVKKVLAKQEGEDLVPIMLRVGDYWEDWQLVEGVKSIALYDNDDSRWDYANYQWIDAPVEAGYYLVGSMNEWKADGDYLFSENAETDGEYMLFEVTLAAGNEIKVAYFNGTDIETWYPDGMGNHYTVAADGSYDIYFRPDAQGGDDWHEGYFYVAPHSGDGIEHVALDVKKAKKMVVDGQLYIVREGKLFNVAGAQVR